MTFIIRKHDERGATMVLIAISLVALLGLTGVVMDGGWGFSDRRQTQNAADAAALAGAQKVNEYLLGQTVTVADVVSTVSSYGGATNDANQTALCWFIDDRGYPIDSANTEYVNQDTAPQCGTFATFPSNVAGVRVVTADVKNTNFIKAVGISTFKAGAVAKAQVEGFSPDTASAPVMLCAIGPGDGRTTSGGLFVQQYPTPSPLSATIPILKPDDTINPAAVGIEYWLKGVEVKWTCTGDANFKGLPDDGDFPVPGDWTHDTGNHAGPARLKLANGCNGQSVGCLVVIPLCHASSVSPGDFWCVRFGVFKITFTDSNSMRGVFQRGGTIADGGAGGGRPDLGDLRVVKLSQ